MSDWNVNIIEEFRGSQGKVGGMFEGWDMLLLQHKGAKTGTERVTPLTFQPVDGNYAIFASKGGATNHPDWYHNLLAHPKVAIEVGTETIAVKARVAAGKERDRIWTKQKQDRPQFGEYEKTANRQIPVVVLEPAQA